MSDHPDIRELEHLHPSRARDGVLHAIRAAIWWATVIAIMAAAPCILWLWKAVL